MLLRAKDVLLRVTKQCFVNSGSSTYAACI